MSIDGCVANTRGITSQRTNHRMSKVALMRPKEDPMGKYIPYCSFHQHMGMVTQNHQLCETRQCTHYKKLYLDKDSAKVRFGWGQSG